MGLLIILSAGLLFYLVYLLIRSQILYYRIKSYLVKEHGWPANKIRQVWKIHKGKIAKMELRGMKPAEIAEKLISEESL